jgi:hypothetical protein
VISSEQSRTHLLANEEVDVPIIAAGSAVKAAAKRFASAYDLPPAAAFAFAAATVDPAAERNKINNGRPTDHLRLIQTPSGLFLACHYAQLWTANVSGDGSNGRSRYSIQTARQSAGSRLRPWPIGRHHRPAIIDYHTPALSDMVSAVQRSASEIRSSDLITQIGRNPRGVWNPPVVVLARALVCDGDEREEFWFPHTIEGSTRVEACHELTDVDPGDPLRRSDDPLGNLREVHARLGDRFETAPENPRTLAAARAVSMPALVVVAVMDEDGVPIENGFPDVVNDYVESVHVQPRPFNEVAQSNVLGERFLLTLRQEGRLDPDEVRALLGRDPDVDGKATVRAARLVHAVCDPLNDHIVRDIVITEERARLTKVRRAKLVGPLIVRQFVDPEVTAERALMRPFTPDALIDRPWAISGVDSDELRRRCQEDHAAGRGITENLQELMARGGPALCAAGVLLGDQGSTVREIGPLRGHVEKVIEKLAGTVGGIEVLADAVAWGDGETAVRPRQFRPDGSVKTDEDGVPLRYPRSWEEGNMQIRALAFTNGVVPQEGEADVDTEDLTPEQRYEVDENALVAALRLADTHLRDLLSVEDDQGRRLVEQLGLRKETLYTSVPNLLTKAYHKFGKDEDIADEL